LTYTPLTKCLYGTWTAQQTLSEDEFSVEEAVNRSEMENS
jgi:hypothetical protein